MNARTPSDDATVSVLREAIAPYPWRGFTPALLARLALAARDREELTTVLGGVQGVAVGDWQRLEPVDRSDVRVSRIVGFLAELRWAESSLHATCGNLARVLGPELR